MTVQAYYLHARNLGAFRAIDALALARQAMTLDVQAQQRKTVPHVEVDREDGFRLSYSVRVF